MSAIGGILRFDGQAVDRRDLERIANALRPHGPDRSDIFVGGNIGLVHALMRMAPEDSFDRQPFRGASGSIITADLRLDNRSELIDGLELSRERTLNWSDSRVLLAGWEKLGNDIWKDVRGPFSAAIWDPREGRLTLARDHLGLNVVMYYKTDKFLAFATMPKGLFALPDVPRQLDEEKMADFIVLNHADFARTFYKDVFRVLPAHFMSLTPGGKHEQRRYWSVKDVARIRLGSDQEYAEGLRDVLDRAVRRQMRSAHPIGCLLSGGLDSSSVAALAARALGNKGQRLPAFTQVPREGFRGPVPAGRYADETPLVEEIREKAGNIDVTYVRNDQVDDFADLERLFAYLEGPPRNPTNVGWSIAILRLARARGIRVLLGGQWGNYTISWFGWSQAPQHLLQGRLLTAYRQWRLYYENCSESRAVTFRRLFLEPMAPRWLADWVHVRRHGRKPGWLSHAPLRSEFASLMKVDQRARDLGHDFLYRLQLDERASNLAGVDYFGDWRAAEQALHGVETRDPTADIDVLEYCFGVPPQQFLAEDIDRSLIRRAMWGLLPVSVLRNRLIGLQSADWYEKIEARKDELRLEIDSLSNSQLVSKCLDLPKLINALDTWPNGGWHKRRIIEEYHLRLSRGISHAKFLRWYEQANR